MEFFHTAPAASRHTLTVFTKSAIFSAISAAFSVVFASTMTRISASVPEGRTRMRPAPQSASSSAFTAFFSAGDAITASFTPRSWDTGTFTSTCGYVGQAAASSEARLPEVLRT